MESEESLDYILLAKDQRINVLVQQEQSYDVNRSEQNESMFATRSDQLSDEKNEYLDTYLTETNDEEKETNGPLKEETKMLREQDLYLPLTNISRIMKQSLPENGKISKDAKNIMQECVSEFISFITSEACEMVKTEKRKTLNGDDIIMSMEKLGFDNYVPVLKLYLQRYKQLNSTTN